MRQPAAAAQPQPATLASSRPLIRNAPQLLVVLSLLLRALPALSAATPTATFTEPPAGVLWRGWAHGREVWGAAAPTSQPQGAQVCRKQGGRLISVLDDSDHASLGTVLAATFWVGLSSNNPGFEPRWLDGSGGKPWVGTDSPDSVGGFYAKGATIAKAPEPFCAALLNPTLHGPSSGGMAAINCTARLPFICGLPKGANTASLAPYGNFIQFSNFTAVVVRAPLTWLEARDWCAARQATLLDLSSPNDAQLEVRLPSPLTPAAAAGRGQQLQYWLGLEVCSQLPYNGGMQCRWDGVPEVRQYGGLVPTGQATAGLVTQLECNDPTVDASACTRCAALDSQTMNWVAGVSCAESKMVLCEAVNNTAFQAYTTLVDGWEYSIFPHPTTPDVAKSICAQRGAALAPASAPMDAALLTWLADTWARGQGLLVDGSNSSSRAAPGAASRKMLAAAAATDQCWVLGGTHVNDSMLFVPGLLSSVACGKAVGAFACRKEVSTTHMAGADPAISPVFITGGSTTTISTNTSARALNTTNDPAAAALSGIARKQTADHKRHDTMSIGVIFAITFSAALLVIAALTAPLVINRRRRRRAAAAAAPPSAPSSKSKLSKPGGLFKFPLFRPLDTANGSSNESAPIPHGRAPPTNSLPSTDPHNATHSSIDTTAFPFRSGEHSHPHGTPPASPRAAAATAAAAAAATQPIPPTPPSPPSEPAESNVLHVVLDMDPEKDLRVFRDQKLGHGAFGAVFKGEYFGVPVAVKTLDVLSMVGLSSSLASWSSSASTGASAEVAAIKQELEILSQVQHPNVVKLYGGCLTPPNVLIVMELMEYSLAEYIKRAGRRLPLKTSLQVVRAVAAGLTHLHPTIIHRDLKPQNILLDSSGNVKISDFGVSRVKMATYLTTQHQAAGTIPYMAPECYSDGPVTEKFDIYSLGMILWECLSGQSPWKDWTAVAIMYHVGCLKGRPPLPEDPNVCPPEVAALIDRCWSADPSDRPAAADIVEEINRIEAALPDP